MKMFVIVGFTAVLALQGYGFNLDANSAVSPDGKNVIRLYSDPLAYEVVRGGVVVVAKTEIGLKMNGKCAMEGAKAPVNVVSKTVSGFAASPVYKKGKVALDANETFVDFGDWGVLLAARNDGVAYRFETKKPCIVDCEKADVTIPKSARCWFNRTPRPSLGCEETLPEFADAATLRTAPRISVFSCAVTESRSSATRAAHRACFSSADASSALVSSSSCSGVFRAPLIPLNRVPPVFKFATFPAISPFQNFS